MANRIKIEDKDLLVLIEFEDKEYGKIIDCIDENGIEVFVIGDKIVKDKNVINSINKKYHIQTPEDFDERIY